jgi:rhamnose transport system permease protein
MATQMQQSPNFGQRLRSLCLSQEGILFLILVMATFVLSFFNKNFLSINNLLNQARLLCEVGLIALPMTYIIITGGIDLSVGSILGLCAILLGIFWKAGMPLGWAIVAVLIIGIVAGAFNALFIVWLDVPPLIMTLATLALYRGMAQGISQARSVRGYPEWFYIFGQKDIWGLPTQLWFFLIGIMIAAIVLARTTLGRALYAIGNNVVGARFSGLRVSRAFLIIYSFSGFMAALAAVVYVSRVTTTRSDMGTGLELDAIAAVVLGGTSIMGGKGTILGTVIGLLIIQLLKYGLQLAGVTGDATIIVIGSVLIVTVLLNNLIQRSRRIG